MGGSERALSAQARLLYSALKLVNLGQLVKFNVNSFDIRNKTP
jgi:hypothetical protein